MSDNLRYYYNERYGNSEQGSSNTESNGGAGSSNNEPNREGNSSSGEPPNLPLVRIRIKNKEDRHPKMKSKYKKMTAEERQKHKEQKEHWKAFLEHKPCDKSDCEFCEPDEESSMDEAFEQSESSSTTQYNTDSPTTDEEYEAANENANTNDGSGPPCIFINALSLLPVNNALHEEEAAVVQLLDDAVAGHDENNSNNLASAQATVSGTSFHGSLTESSAGNSASTVVLPNNPNLLGSTATFNTGQGVFLHEPCVNIYCTICNPNQDGIEDFYDSSSDSSSD